LLTALGPLALKAVNEYTIKKYLLLVSISMFAGLALVIYLCYKLLQRKYPDTKIKGDYLLAGLLIAVTTCVLLAKEYHLYHLSFCPGSRFCGNDFTETKPSISNQLMADERGMAYYNPAYYAGKRDSTGLIINKDGFPATFDFSEEQRDTLSTSKRRGRKKILFLGDSFLEGVGASTHDKSFIELYKNRNPDKVIYSTGIGGMDVIQYRLVAEKYIPVIRPERVVVMFCGWNDLIWLDRKPRPYMPTHTFVDKVGIIYNYVPPGITPFDTLVLGADSAYQLYRNRFSLMGKKGLIERIAAKSRVTTQLYYAAKPIEFYPNQFAPDSLATYRNLKRIKDICDSSNIPLSIIFIPTPLMKDYTAAEYERRYKWVFKDMWPLVRFCPKGYIQAEDCSTEADYHFNDKGQKKFADYMQTLNLK